MSASSSRSSGDKNDGEDGDDGSSVPPDEELEQFRHQVREYCKLDEQVRKLRVALSERRRHMAALSRSMSTFMQTYDIQYANTAGMGRIASTIRRVKAPLRLSDVRERLRALPDGVRGDDLVKAVFEAERPVTERASVRRIVPRARVLDLEL